MYDLISHHSTTSEMIYHVPLDNSRHIAYQCYIPDLESGDLLVCGSQHEITNIQNYFMATCHRMILTKNKDDLDGILICPANGIDIPACKAYHVNPSCTGTLEIPKDDKSWGEYHYVSQIIYCGSVWAKSGDYCKLEQGYGKLWVLIYRPKNDEK